jgi:hypothetical protein
MVGWKIYVFISFHDSLSLPPSPRKGGGGEKRGAMNGDESYWTRARVCLMLVSISGYKNETIFHHSNSKKKKKIKK